MSRKTRFIRGFSVLMLLAPIALLLPVPAHAAGGRVPPHGAFGPTVYLPLVFGPARARSSFELIDDALAAGRLDAETALVYEVYATLDAGRLPAQYRGPAGEGMEGHDVLRTALARWATLSPTTQELLFPFFQPPLYVGSWYDQRFFPQLRPQVLETGEIPNSRPGLVSSLPTILLSRGRLGE